MVKRMRSFLSAVMLVIAATVNAQVTTSSMSGKLVDTNNEVIIGATVQAIHEPSGTHYGAITNFDGRYSIQGMRAGGPYKVEISYIGYQTLIFKDINLQLGDNYVLDAQLKESSELLDEVVVTASKSSNMKSDRAGAVTNIGSERMSLVPTVSRSLNDVMRLTPQGANTTGSGFAVGGGNYRQSYVTVDGAAFSNAFGIGSNLPGGGSPISLDALEQVSISVTPYDVRQSGFTGGAINAVTKSGTNDFKGTVYTYLSNESLKGDHIGDTNLNVEKSQYYTYGASLGGAIIKNKLFFFVNGEYEDNVSAGPTAIARTDASQVNFDDVVHRPFATTTTDASGRTWIGMDNMSSYLMEKYNYNPGRYQNYSIKTPAYKVVARVDWNINDNHKLNVRFTRAHSKDNSGPSSSTSPLYANDIYPGGDGISKGSGRGKAGSLYFESARYFKEYNFTSYAAEWNSKWLEGRLNNVLRATYSFQDEPRSYEGDLNFPTVDILENGALYATFGPDVFTVGNLGQAKTWVVTDEASYNMGIHNFVLGYQFEHNKAVNGFQQAGNGYYVYSSWDDFVNNRQPAAFGMMHSNSEDLSQFMAKMTTMQHSLYLQDQMNISDNFKLTAGIRFELPVYPSLKDNYNKDFAEQSYNGIHYSTDQLPDAKITVSPRVGFNWDMTGERKYVLRGGTGIYVGRMPFVWLVSTVGNSNVGQTSYFFNKREEATGVIPSFHGSDRKALLQELYGGNFKPKELKASNQSTILDKDLTMPTTWKTSLAFDAKLPGDIDFTLEGIFNKDLQTVVVSNPHYYVSDETVALNDNDVRHKLGQYPGVQDAYLLENGPHGAYYYSITAQLAKRFDFGLNMSVAYTHACAKSYGDGVGDQVSSAYKNNMYSIDPINAHELGFGNYVSPHRIIASVGYRKEYAKHFASAISLIYEGMNTGYDGWGYGGARHTYTFSSNVLGDKANSLLYIPASRNELDSWNFEATEVKDDNGKKMAYTADMQRDDFWNYINNDSYLKGRKGKYTERGGAVMPWHHQLDLKFMQDFYMNIGGKRNTLQVGVDIKNFLNLLNSKWGTYKKINNDALLSYKNGAYQFQQNNGKRLTSVHSDYMSLNSTYSVQFSVRYLFN
ncbi:carboxypeptidase regulatory-like domain-containing protein [Phocaeicola faecalis]|uniref:TonB-dependent receptor n=1 Tax=Phocaeicola faecalis TaxID=2786956 RepID=UPI001F2FA329|nr:carboxypeptidase regulatory-like domain-containing protein [Phocaeicola faecalis]